jgi:uncharacterized protein (DUF2267 family)
MDHDTFIGEVQNRAELASRGAALSASRAALETLGNRIQKGEATDLAAQLSDELGRYLEEHDTTESFAFGEFTKRVAERDENLTDSDEDRSTAAFHARVVVDVLSDAVSEGEFSNVRNSLPEEYDQLFELADADEHPGSE